MEKEILVKKTIDSRYIVEEKGCLPVVYDDIASFTANLCKKAFFDGLAQNDECVFEIKINKKD